MGKMKFDILISDRIIKISVRIIIFITMIVSAGTGIMEVYQGNDGGHLFMNAFTCLLMLIITFAPSYINNKTRMIVPTLLQTGIVLFTFAAMYLGNLSGYYSIFPWWDVMLHSTSGFMLGLIGFLLFYSLNRDRDFVFNLNYICIALFAFCFAMTCGVIWEFYEYFCDCFLGMNLQRSFFAEDMKDLNNYLNSYGRFMDPGLVDTMKDLIVDAIGAALSVIICFTYVKLHAEKTGKDSTQRLRDMLEKSKVRAMKK